jgi:hypothetical protein
MVATFPGSSLPELMARCATGFIQRLFETSVGNVAGVSTVWHTTVSRFLRLQPGQRAGPARPDEARWLRQVQVLLPTRGSGEPVLSPVLYTFMFACVMLRTEQSTWPQLAPQLQCDALFLYKADSSFTGYAATAARNVETVVHLCSCHMRHVH